MTQNILLTGDVMLGRLVDKYVLAKEKLPASYVWGDILPYFRKADIALINLECVISQKGEKWQPGVKVFHFRARPRAVDALITANIDFVSLANNHVLDFGEKALLDCLKLLKINNITYAGVGENIKKAVRPAFIENKNIKVGIVSLTDNEPEWQAGEDKPGINFIDYDKKGLKEPYYSRIKKAIDKAKKKTDLVIVAAHVGPNWGTPSGEMISLTHQLVDFGADLYWGHSNHTTQGIEAYKGKPILYSTGDFIDDYAIDSVVRNDLSFLFEVVIESKKIKEIILRPVKIENLQVNLAEGEDAEWVIGRMMDHCQAFGTKLGRHHNALVIVL